MSKDDGYTRYTMRIPSDLYDRIKAAAGEKSVNAEILGVLEKQYPAPVPVAERLAAVHRILDKARIRMVKHEQELKNAIANKASDSELERVEAALMREKELLEEIGKVQSMLSESFGTD